MSGSSAARSGSRASILLRSEHPRGAYALRQLRALARTFLTQLRERRELSLLLTTDARIARLNGDWRGKRRPTDVLSFGGAEGSPVLGDVVISLDTARRQARERGKPVVDELARLLAHGLLHLRGHDHERDADARRMARAEVRLLGTIGLVGDALATRPSELEFHRTRLRKAPHPRYAARPRTGGGPGRSSTETRR